MGGWWNFRIFMILFGKIGVSLSPEQVQVSFFDAKAAKIRKVRKGKCDD